MRTTSGAALLLFIIGALMVGASLATSRPATH